MSSGRRVIGFFLLLSGWLIVLADVMLLKPGVSRVAFVLGGLAVQTLGLVFIARDHMRLKGEAS
jgi:hypothetical protein